MAAVTPATMSALLKDFYTPSIITKTIASRVSDVFKDLKKKFDVDGKQYVSPFIVGDVPSGSPDFPTAQTAGNAAAPVAVQFQVPPRTIVSTFTISDQAIRQSRGERGGWEQLLKVASESAFRTAGFKLSVAMVGSGWGNIGSMANSAFNTSVVTLNIKSDINKFQQWDQIQLSPSITANAADNAGVVGWVKSVDYSAGTFVVAASYGGAAANISTIWAAAAQNDVIFLAGWRDFTQTDGAPTHMVAPHGLKTLIPDVNNRPQGGEAFDGVDRSQNPVFLAGTAIDGTGKALQDALFDGVMNCIQYGGATDPRIALSPKRYNDLVKANETQARFNDGARLTLGFPEVTITLKGVTAKLLADLKLADSECYIYDKDAFVMVSWGQSPAIVEEDGLMIARQATTLGYEGRILSLVNFTLDNPAATCNVLLPTT